MHRIIPLLVVALLAACDDREEQATARQTQAAVQQVEYEQGDGFVLLSGADTVGVERFTRSDDMLEGELTSEGDRVRYRATTGSDALITRLELESYPSGSATREEWALLTFQGDSVIAEWQENGSTRRDADAAPAGTMAYFSPSVALLEQALRRARAIGGERVEIPVLIVSAQRDVRMERAIVTWIGTDSAHIQVDQDNQMRVAVDAQGNISGGVNPPQNVRVDRIR
jgi:hypothetical protein